jgi:NAD(P)-dependent dehydrogenase (short-subunit alcohol dehydrogenase family)
MVSLEAIRESNARIASELPAGLVAVFFGATSGIGETTLKQFAKRARQPRIYFVGRREEEGNCIKIELKTLNPDGEYHYMKCDASLLKNVDQLCREIKSKESAINLLFITVGNLTLIMGKRKYLAAVDFQNVNPLPTTSALETEEDLHYPMALGYYVRIRFIVNLLPLLSQATSLRRVVTILAGSKEGKIFTDDFQARNHGFPSVRGHVTSMITLGLDAIAKQAPNVSFIHDYPGFVKTGMSRELTGLVPAIMKVVFSPIMAILKIPNDEVGERQTFFATCARFLPAAGEPKADGLNLGEGVETAVSTDGIVGGVYSIDYEAEGTDLKVQEILAQLRKDGTAEKAWKHTQDEFLRITGSLALQG